jgi:N utilization substance protein B
MKSLVSAQGLSSAHLREARRFSVQYVYQCDLTQQTFFQENSLKTFFEQFEVAEEERTFVRELVRLTLENLVDLDARIEQVSRNWKLSRIAKVDLAVLRVCTQEILAREDVGLDILISDAAEIGKQYGSQASGGFVNGILDAIAKQARHRAP